MQIKFEMFQISVEMTTADMVAAFIRKITVNFIHCMIVKYRRGIVKAVRESLLPSVVTQLGTPWWQ